MGVLSSAEPLHASHMPVSINTSINSLQTIVRGVNWRISSVTCTNVLVYKQGKVSKKEFRKGL